MMQKLKEQKKINSETCKIDCSSFVDLADSYTIEIFNETSLRNEPIKKVVINDGTKHDYIFLLLGSYSYDFIQNRKIEIGDNTSVNFYYCFLAEKSFTLNLEYNIRSNSKVTHNIVYQTKGNQQSSVNEVFNYLGKNSEGQFICEGVALDEARVNYNSTIVVDKKTLKNKADLNMKLHLLSKSSSGAVLPALAIKSASAQISHSAKIYNFTKENVDYLMTRGLNMHSANVLLKTGIFKVFINKIKKYNLDVLNSFYAN